MFCCVKKKIFFKVWSGRRYKIKTTFAQSDGQIKLIAESQSHTCTVNQMEIVLSIYSARPTAAHDNLSDGAPQ